MLERDETFHDVGVARGRRECLRECGQRVGILLAEDPPLGPRREPDEAGRAGDLRRLPGGALPVRTRVGAYGHQVGKPEILGRPAGRLGQLTAPCRPLRSPRGPREYRACVAAGRFGGAGERAVRDAVGVALLIVGRCPQDHDRRRGEDLRERHLRPRRHGSQVAGGGGCDHYLGRRELGAPATARGGHRGIDRRLQTPARGFEEHDDARDERTLHEREVDAEDVLEPVGDVADHERVREPHRHDDRDDREAASYGQVHVPEAVHVVDQEPPRQERQHHHEQEQRLADDLLLAAGQDLEPRHDPRQEREPEQADPEGAVEPGGDVVRGGLPRQVHRPPDEDERAHEPYAEQGDHPGRLAEPLQELGPREHHLVVDGRGYHDRGQIAQHRCEARLTEPLDLRRDRAVDERRGQESQPHRRDDTRDHVKLWETAGRELLDEDRQQVPEMPEESRSHQPRVRPWGPALAPALEHDEKQHRVKDGPHEPAGATDDLEDEEHGRGSVRNWRSLTDFGELSRAAGAATRGIVARVACFFK